MKYNILIYILISLNFLNAEDWIHFQGPNKNGISNESNLKLGSLKPLWKTNINTGFSSITTYKNFIYSMGNKGNKDYVYALDNSTGKIIWQYSYMCQLTPNLYEGGPNSTPTFHDKKLYTLSKEGHIFCFDAINGKVIWKMVINKKTTPKPKWGYTSSPTIVDNMVLINAGNSGLALHKDTGKILWESKGSKAGYASLQVISKTNSLMLTANSLKSVFHKTGKIQWSLPFEARFDINAAAPIIINNKVLVSNGYGTGRTHLYDISNPKPKLIWETQDLKLHFNTAIILDDYVYAITGNAKKRSKFKCVSLKTGETKWEKTCKFGSLRASSDHKIFHLDEKGLLTVIEASSESYKEIISNQILDQTCWTPPTISHKKLFARNSDGDLIAIDLND